MHQLDLPSERPRKFAFIAFFMVTVFWDAERIVLMDCPEHGSTITRHHRNLLCWSDQKSSGGTEGEETRKVRHGLLFCQDNAPAHTSSQAQAASEMPDSNYSLTHCIHLTWLQATFICFLNWANLLTTRTLSAWEMAGWKTKINNSSTIESEHWRNAGPSAFQLKENMLKSDKIWCAYLMVNFVRLQTFWTPLVRITDNACIRCSCVHLLLWLQVESRSYTIRFMSCWHYTGTKKYWCQHWCCSALDWSVSCIFLFLCNLFIILLFSIKHIYVPIVPCNFVIIVSSVILVHNFLF